ncbi:MAG: oligosaccharide flippase family protein [Erythrobacter sp.]|nr:oligosaccharide flippase family protein [Erythrobacter sp.]
MLPVIPVIEITNLSIPIARLRTLLTTRNGGIASYMAQGVSASFLLQGAGLALVTGSSILLARLLGAEGYGVYAYVLAWIEVLKVPIAYGLPIMIQREVALYAGRGDWGLMRGLSIRVNQFILLTSAAIILISAAIAASGLWNLFDTPSARYTIYIALVSLPLAAWSAARAAALNGLRMIARAAFPDQVVRHCITILTVLIFWGWLGRLTPETAMIAQVTGIAAAFALGAWLLYSSLPQEFHKQAPQFAMGQWLRDLGPFLLHGASYAIWASLAVVMIGWFRPADEAGIYRAAALVAGLSVFPITAFVATVSPLVARLNDEGDRERMQQLVNVTTTIMFGFAFCGFFSSILLGEWFLEFVFGPQFGAGYWVLVILTGGNWIFSGMWSVALLLDMSGGQRFPALAYAVALVINLALGVALIPQFGVVGAAIATASSWSIVHVGLAITVWRRLSIRPDIFHALLWAIKFRRESRR